MKLILYLLNKAMLPIYLAVSAVISAVIAVFGEAFVGIFLRCLPCVVLLLLLIRACDDIGDYEADSGRKTQHLSKRVLMVFAAVLAVMYIAADILLFGVWGTLSVLAVLYLPLMDRLPVLKSLYMPLLFLMYLRLNDISVGIPEIAAAAGCLAAALLFHIYKLHRRKVRK